MPVQLVCAVSGRSTWRRYLYVALCAAMVVGAWQTVAPPAPVAAQPLPHTPPTPHWCGANHPTCHTVQHCAADPACIFSDPVDYALHFCAAPASRCHGLATRLARRTPSQRSVNDLLLVLGTRHNAALSPLTVHVNNGGQAIQRYDLFRVLCQMIAQATNPSECEVTSPSGGDWWLGWHAPMYNRQITSLSKVWWYPVGPPPATWENTIANDLEWIHAVVLIANATAPVSVRSTWSSWVPHLPPPAPSHLDLTGRAGDRVDWPWPPPITASNTAPPTPVNPTTTHYECNWPPSVSIVTNLHGCFLPDPPANINRFPICDPRLQPPDWICEHPRANRSPSPPLCYVEIWLHQPGPCVLLAQKPGFCAIHATNPMPDADAWQSWCRMPDLGLIVS